MNRVRLIVLGISYGQSQTGGYILVLGERNGKRRLPVVIPPLEAQAIAIQLESIIPPRPLTHDLFFNTVRLFGIEMLEANIIRFEDGIFISEIVFFDGEKQLVQECYTSDAVALAMRFRCPIFTTPEVMEQAGIVIDEEDELDSIYTPDSHVEDPTSKPDLSKYTNEELEELLSEAVGREDYEHASILRDELKRRKSK